MPLPSLILGVLIALLLGALFHLWVDGGPARLMLYMLLSLVGFGVGQWVGSTQGMSLFPVGALDLGMAVVGSLVFLGAGYWLSLVRVQDREPRKRV